MSKAKKAAGGGPAEKVITCTPVVLPQDQWEQAAASAIDVYPPNAPHGETDPKRIGVLASKFWGGRAADLTFTFLESVSQAMIDKMTAFANSWGEFSRVRARYTSDLSSAVVRIAFGNSGYWSYLGTDCLQIPRNQPTMNLQQFTVNTRESEWHRVVKHEWGHAWGCPHEQQRRDVLALLDVQKTIAYFRATQGWSEAEVRAQILTPLEERSLMNPSPADVTSIMCYQFPGSITKNGQAIPGGMDFSAADKTYFAKTYPRDDAPPPPPPPPPGEIIAVMAAFDAGGKEIARFKRV